MFERVRILGWVSYEFIYRKDMVFAQGLLHELLGIQCLGCQSL